MLNNAVGDKKQPYYKSAKPKKIVKKMSLLYCDIGKKKCSETHCGILDWILE